MRLGAFINRYPSGINANFHSRVGLSELSVNDSVKLTLTLIAHAPADCAETANRSDELALVGRRLYLCRQH